MRSLVVLSLIGYYHTVEGGLVAYKVEVIECIAELLTKGTNESI